MKAGACLAFVLALRGVSWAMPVQWDAGASYFLLQHARFEQRPPPLTVADTDRAAPFVGITASCSERFALRFTYHFVDHLRATAQFAFHPGDPPSPIPIVVWGHYNDDVHLLSLAPELRLRATPRLTFEFAPQVNWVASRGMVRYSTTNALILLIAPQPRKDDGFTLGGGVRMQWSLNRRAAASLGYHFIDLRPSFEREAHVLSAALGWTF